MEAYKARLKLLSKGELKKMHFHSKGYEKEIIESVLIEKMYKK